MKVNKWKKLFFFLLGLNILILIYIFITVSLPINEKKTIKPSEVFQGYVPFHIYTEKANLTEVINHYIKEETTGSPIKYRVHLEEEVELYGVITVFGQELQMKMTFEPTVLENGDLILEQQSMSIGQMNLPVAYILKFIQDRYRLPKGVEIRPDEKRVLISMGNIKVKSGFKIKVSEFDLKRDNISFLFFVPVK